MSAGPNHAKHDEGTSSVGISHEPVEQAAAEQMPLSLAAVGENNRPASASQNFPARRESPQPAAAGCASTKVVLSIPTRNGGANYSVTEEMVREWQELYPELDVSRVLTSIRAWNHANQQRRKTTAGMHRHINNWLLREREKLFQARGQPCEPYKYGNNIVDEIKRLSDAAKPGYSNT